MTVKIDFSLGRRFGVVEQTIFRLVLNGLTDAKQISDLLWVFSDVVIAKAFRRLVNQQIIRVNIESHKLSLSDAIVAIIEMCVNTSYDLDMPDSLVEMMSDGHLLITDVNTKEAILAQLLPDIKLAFLARSLDFSICERGEMDEH
ncbi:hypothetical protein [Paenibacillus sp. BK720]|uniref:hypothetical protein n=1 Tax=Paenibacillus sp. BK720 TaxID=2587092 RepID=UPI00141E532B|nr:hypothetical protein [Paenibacillus sp. BK720]NIK70450.1 uncharacterized membrane protein YraQ (UPF0718 family) [Paenibacillus sp. BK720]